LIFLAATTDQTNDKPHFHIDPNSSHTSLTNHTEKSTTDDGKQLPADIRLNMLTGVPTNRSKSRSPASSTSTIGERSKDALSRINELIRQNSVQDVENKMTDDVFNDHDVLLTSNEFDKRRQSDDISPIQFYINETNKLTSNLENSTHEQERRKMNITNLDDDDDHIQQVSHQ
jgi:hypothetical protein